MGKISMDAAKNGLMRYVDEQILPQLDTKRRIGLGIYVALAAENAMQKAKTMAQHPAVAITGIMDENGKIDIDRLHDEAAKQMRNGEKISMEIPMIGKFSFDKTDVDKVCQYMKEEEA